MASERLADAAAFAKLTKNQEIAARNLKAAQMAYAEAVAATENFVVSLAAKITGDDGWMQNVDETNGYSSDPVSLNVYIQVKNHHIF